MKRTKRTQIWEGSKSSRIILSEYAADLMVEELLWLGGQVHHKLDRGNLG